jgi:hypothetical protein
LEEDKKAASTLVDQLNAKYHDNVEKIVDIRKKIVEDLEKLGGTISGSNKQRFFIY